MNHAVEPFCVSAFTKNKNLQLFQYFPTESAGPSNRTGKRSKWDVYILKWQIPHRILSYFPYVRPTHNSMHLYPRSLPFFFICYLDGQVYKSYPAYLSESFVSPRPRSRRYTETAVCDPWNRISARVCVRASWQPTLFCAFVAGDVRSPIDRVLISFRNYLAVWNRPVRTRSN